MDRSELDQLKADLRRMQARVDELEKTQEEPTNRRNMLRGLGAAAAGAAVGGLAFARPAAAASGDTLIIGNTNAPGAQNAQHPTGLIADTSWTVGSRDWGILHVSNDPAFENANAIASCISAYGNGSETGGHNVGMFVGGTSTGAKLDGPVPLKISDSTSSGPPSSSFGRTGQFKNDEGDLWFCTYDDGIFGGENPKWRKLAGPDSAGAFHAVTPFRAYDSRAASPSPGLLTGGNSRTVSVAASRDNAGNVLNANAVPSGATAVSANLTVTGTTGSFGFLCVNPGGSISQDTSAINWFGAGQNLANGLSFTLDTSRQVTVVCGTGGGSTHFIIDIFGYYL